MECKECGRGEYRNFEQVIQDVLKYRDDITFSNMRVTYDDSIRIGANIAVYIPVDVFQFYNAYEVFNVMSVLYHNDKEIQILGYAEKQETLN